MPPALLCRLRHARPGAHRPGSVGRAVCQGEVQQPYAASDLGVAGAAEAVETVGPETDRDRGEQAGPEGLLLQGP